MTNSDYDLVSTETTVRFWTRRRLPLQPRGAALDGRTRLRNALRRLQPPNETVLCAVYASLDDSFCDVENVLIYNVGTGAFRGAAMHGVAFARRRGAPPLSPTGQRFPHYHEYRLAALPSRPTNVESCSFVFEPPPITTSIKAHDVWWRATDAVGTRPTPLAGPFTLHIELGTVQPVANVAGTVKPLLDGIVCAMHSDRAPNDAAIKRLSRTRDWDEGAITRKLRAPANPLLGDRRIVNCYRDFVKWDPADHLCEACTVLIVRDGHPRCHVTVTALH